MDDQKPNGGQEYLRARRFLAFIGIFLVLVGQVYFFATPIIVDFIIPQYSWLTLLGVLILITSQVVRPARFIQALFAKVPLSRTTTWVLVAATLSGLTILATITFSRYGQVNYIPVTTIWIGSWISYIAAFNKSSFDPARWLNWFKAHRNEILIVSAITLAGFALRFYKLGVLPRIVDGDEGRLGLTAIATATSNLSNPFALWENFGGLYLQGVNIIIHIFGTTPLAVRFIPAVSGVLAIPAIYLLARLLAGRRVALLAAIFLTTSHAHIHFSRVAAVGYIHSTWLAPLELYFFLSAIKNRSSLRAAIGGTLLAIHYTIYLTSQVITGMLLVYIVLAFIFFRDWIKPALRQVLTFWGGFLISVSPELVYIAGHMDQFLDRLSQDGTFQSGWLAETVARTGQSAFLVLGQRVLHAFLSLIYFPARDFYGSQIPMLTFIAAALFIVGAGIALWKTRSPEILLLNGYFWAPTIAIGMFAIPPSADSYRMLSTLPAAMIMASIALDLLLKSFGLGWAESRPAYVFTSACILTGMFAFNLWAYYGDFVGKCRYGDNLVSRYASYLGSYVNSVSNESDIYLLSDKEYFYGSHASVDYLSGRRPIKNIPGPIDTIQAVSGETIVATPNRIIELADWARANPGGKLHYEYDCDKTILLSYQLP
jgi:hypothetical protein